MKHVLIDCEKIKYPNTGLYTFCLELARSIGKIAPAEGVEPQFLVKSRNVELMQGLKVRALKVWDKICFRMKQPVFHATYHYGKYMPSSKKMVLTIHDLNFIYDRQEAQHDGYKQRLKANVAKASHVVFISEFARQDYIKHIGELPCRNSVIYNGCSLYTGVQTAKAEKYQPTREFLFSVGTILPKKNFHVLPALLVGNDYELVIAGKMSSYADKIMEEAKLYGVESRVKIVAEISEADKDWYYRNCRAFVFPSIAEGFGIPAIEALAYGKPTFLSQHTSLPEVGGKYSYYFDMEFNRENMQEELRAGLADFESRDISEQQSYARSFSWDNAAKAYIDIYKSL